MDDNSLKHLWLKSGGRQKVEINTELLIESLNKNLSFMEKQIKRRDRIEIIICVLMIPLFGWWLFTVPQILAKVGAAIITINCILVIFRLIRATRVIVKSEPASEMKKHLTVSLQLVKKQIRLLDSVLWWYLLPFFVGVICFFYAFPMSIFSKVIYTVAVAAMYAYIWYLNKKVVRKKLKPLEGNIMKALNELSE